MQRRTFAGFASILLAAVACGSQPDGTSSVETTRQELAGDQARGTIPSGLPARLTVGLFEGPGETWMRNSGVAWDVRYQYFTKGWVNNWGWGSNDGSWGLGYMRECDNQRFIPAVEYYQVYGEPGGGEGQTLAKVQNASTMASYFRDFKVLMQRAKDFGKPVLVMIEADATGFLQHQTNGNPNAYAAIRDTGMPELSSLPNTVAGWGLAFLQLRKSVGANNAILGMHVSGWASGKDIAYFNVTDPLQPEVDKVYNFLAPMGLTSNVTGATYDVLVADPLDRDADYYRLVHGQDRWWDASDSASISSKSFNRYAEWLRLWNVKANKRWVLWQIPIGNSNSKNVYNNGGPAEGYKDNRAEYFFASGNTNHLEKFANVGVISLLFGVGTGGQTSYHNDVYTDGQLFLRSRAGAFLNAGGLPIARGSGSGGGDGGGGGSGGGGSGGSSGGGSGGGGSGSSDGARYNFESGTQSWSSSGGAIVSVASSTARAYAGSRSLAVNFNGSAGVSLVRVSAPAAPRGATVTFRVWLPSGSRISSIQPYVLQGASGGWAWTGAWRATSSLTTNAWNTITVTVPSNAATPLHELGVEFTTNGTWSGTAYIDAVTW